MIAINKTSRNNPCCSSNYVIIKHYAIYQAHNNERRNSVEIASSLSVYVLPLLG